MVIKLFNTMGRRKMVFRPLKDKNVGIYCCGPTVYDYPHIGNMKTYVNEDVLRRVLELNGYHVTHVMNITDVGHLTSQADTGEDKVEMMARIKKANAYEIARFFTDVFFRDADLLNILRPSIIVKATDHIGDMIEFVKKLEEKGYTYRIEGDGIYFDTSKFKAYGKLTGMNFKRLNTYLKAGARVDVVPGKKNITDFALWKFSPKDVKRQMEWDSPWGVGFPGWHIECSVMSMKYLGDTFDIHCGGVDHIPIHHSNEIAQSEAVTGRKFVRYWVHCEHVLVEGKKMSKSLGNYYTLKDILGKGYTWREVRYLFISAHYRRQLNFTFEGLNAAKASVNRIIDFLRKLKQVRGGTSTRKFRSLLAKTEKEFLSAVNDDLNLPKAIAIVFKFITYVNKMVDSKQVTEGDAEKAIKLILWFDNVLGLKLNDYLVEEALPEEARLLIESREKARQAKDFKLADQIRNTLREKYGILLEDTKDGTRWRRIE